MRAFAVAVLLMTLDLLVLGCGYTILDRAPAREDPCAPDSTARLPDRECSLFRRARNQKATPKTGVALS
jgi:hypothetical protein